MKSVLPAITTLVLILFPLLQQDVPAATASERPNVLFIAIDDLNDWVGCLGGHPQAKTPHIDRLARRGTLLANAHCQSPLCNSSRTSQLTGMRPSTTGVYALMPWFRTSEKWKNWVTLPQYFARHGYQPIPPERSGTMAFRRVTRGLENADVWGPDTRILAKPAKKLVPPTPHGNHPLLDWGTFPHQDQDKGDWQVASWAQQQLEMPAARNRPNCWIFFQRWSSYMVCHNLRIWKDIVSYRNCRTSTRSVYAGQPTAISDTRE